VTPAGVEIAAVIAAHGPIAFSRFMEIALYHPACGYYRRAQPVFGREGDFYTAAQMQPVFGRLLSQAFRQLNAPRRSDGRVLVADWGAGRADLRESFHEFDYRAVDVGFDETPERFEGIVLANELFDALPVDVAQGALGCWRERRVDCVDGQFQWCDGEELNGEWLDYVMRAAQEARFENEIGLIELPVRMCEAVKRIDRALTRGWIVAFDYGYTRRELIRFRQGTLLGYRKHRAFDDALAEPGERDITAHVPFDALREYAASAGWREVRFETMGRFLLRVGESDEFKNALEAPSLAELTRLRLQLKSLLFDLGETFRTVVWEKP
jgi:SAM-dependent MidA family methyltransferase